MTGSGQFDGFVHVAGGQLLDGRGAPLVLRGVGLGNWLLREGYMWKFTTGGPLSSREIESFVAELVGADRGAQFWQEFHRRFITEADIALIAAEGFDHVRLPLNARVLQTDDGALIEEGFRLVDDTIAWCRAHGLWVVLDLHGAPGGQTGTNIDDSPNGIPELRLTSPAYRKLTIDLWRAIAQRYRDETVVAAYDLLNEPIPNEYQYLYANELVALYKDLTAAIREVDDVHTIMYEGSHWATNWDIFTEVWDTNSILQCHKYWSPPDRPSVQKFVDRGRELGLPVYMGETGENNLEWLQAAFQLYDDCGMSWNFWPWKKIETLTSPCSVNAPAGWDALLAYSQGAGPRPTPDDSWRILCELLDAFAPDRCTYRSEVVNAMLRRAPLRMTPWAFSFRGKGVSYESADAKPLTGFRSDDDVTLLCANLNEDLEPDFSHNAGAPRPAEDGILVRLEAGDWVSYDVDVRQAGELCVRVALVDDHSGSPADGSVVVSVGASSVAGIPSTDIAGPLDDVGSDRRVVWATFTVDEPGVQIVRVAAVDGPVVLRWLDFLPE